MQPIEPDWPAPRGVHALVTTRAGGCSVGPYASLNLGARSGDDPAAVNENRRRLVALLPAAPVWLRQVHGTAVVDADRARDEALEPQADAAVARARATVCAVLVADCMPVLLADDGGTMVAAAHAGWRGLSAGVLEATVGAMRVAPQRLIAWLGPAIGPRRYEVGDEVRAAFLARDAAAASAFRAVRPGHWLLDLYAVARQRLAASGVTRVYGGGLCTYSDPARFYSYRREPKTGRMAALIWLENPSIQSLKP
ncbi:MAG TPA: peptidoglycan editing factor PgeF [Burkholderiales bacterium]|nr:peptidoglycan editing factor PgeF [Burkholderiales bacterium]